MVIKPIIWICEMIKIYRKKVEPVEPVKTVKIEKMSDFIFLTGKRATGSTGQPKTMIYYF